LSIVFICGKKKKEQEDEEGSEPGKKRVIEKTSCESEHTNQKAVWRSKNRAKVSTLKTDESLEGVRFREQKGRKRKKQTPMGAKSGEIGVRGLIWRGGR